MLTPTCAVGARVPVYCGNSCQRRERPSVPRRSDLQAVGSAATVQALEVGPGVETAGPSRLQGQKPSPVFSRICRRSLWRRAVRGHVGGWAGGRQSGSRAAGAAEIQAALSQA